MTNKLKSEINRIDKEQLIDLIEQLCTDKNTERNLTMMVCPNKAAINHTIRNFSERCEIYVSFSCNEKDRVKMYDAANPLHAALKYADSKTAAYIIYEMHKAMYENDIIEDEYYEIVGDYLGNLANIVKNSPEDFSEEEMSKYLSIAYEEE